MEEAVPLRASAQSGNNGGVQLLPPGSRMTVAIRERKDCRDKEDETGSFATTTLVDLCRAVLVSNLERYNPRIFNGCDEEEWETIIRVKHSKTQPKEGTGGLDGTGRIAPAVSDKVLLPIEESNPQLAESAVVDQLVWRDCTEYRFRRGGMTRPKGLLLPWPELEKQITEASEKIQELIDNPANDNAALQHIDTLFSLPMNISLLQTTGVGKMIKKAIKSLAKQDREGALKQRMEKLLDSWMALASVAGMQVDKGASPSAASNNATNKEMLEDLKMAETCQTWRQLFAVLKQREEDRRSTQGKRMREKRQNLAADRPKVVKVRPTTAKQQRILDRPLQKGKAAAAAGVSHTHAPPAAAASKFAQVRKEVAMQRKSFKPAATKLSFGDAVSFVSNPKKPGGTKRKTTTHALNGGKRLHVPNNTVSRQFSSKFGSAAKR